MPTILVGGSRQVDHLPDAFCRRLRNIVAGGHRVVVGDAPARTRRSSVGSTSKRMAR